MTGILVSHSVDQVRELCGKILWLDHGSQIAFSRDVELCCDAYEEFLNTKELPRTQEDMERLAQAFTIRSAEAKLAKEKQQAAKLKKLLTKENNEQFLNEAIAIVQKYRPELFRDTPPS